MVMPKVVKPANPERGNYSEDPCDSDVYNCSKFQHSIHEFVKRIPKPENKTSVPENLSNGTRTEPPAPTKTSKNLVPGLSYEKGSVAAASIFGAVALMGFFCLVYLCIKRCRRRWKERHKGIDDGASTASERRRRRLSMMFSKGSSRSYLVEDNNGAVTRVLCTSKRVRSSTAAASDLRALNGSQRGRAGSVPRQIVVISPPLEPVISRAAAPDSQSTKATTLLTFELTEMDQHAESTSSNPNRRSLFRLPSIKKTISPFVRF